MRLQKKTTAHEREYGNDILKYYQCTKQIITFEL